MTTSRWGRKQFLLILNLDKKFYKLKWNDFVHFYSRQKEHHEPVLTMTRFQKFHRTNKQTNKQNSITENAIVKTFGKREKGVAGKSGDNCFLLKSLCLKYFCQFYQLFFAKQICFGTKFLKVTIQFDLVSMQKKQHTI